MIDSIFFNIGIILGVTVAVAFVMRLLRQPLIIAYLVAGIICGPLLLDVVGSNHEFFETFAHFGVVLLLFAVGLGLNFSYLRKIGKVAMVTGIGQVVFTATVGTLILLALNFQPFSAMYLAIAITFSSTIIIVKLLADKRQLQSIYGRYTIGLMLVQDVIAVLIMVLLPLLGVQEAITTAVGILLLKGIVIIAAVMLIARFVLPVLLDRAAQSGEFLFLFTIAWCFIVAGAVHWAGLSLEIGAIIAGISLGSSPYQTEIVSRVKPLRDFFIVLFFILLGSEITVGGIEQALIPGLILAAFVLVGNPIILFVLYRMMRFTRRNSFLAGLTAAQVSEFGFVLLFLGQQMGHVSQDELSVFTVVALVTIFVSSYLITYNTNIYTWLRPLIHRLFGKDKMLAVKETPEQYDAWVFGYHRIGWKICEGLAENGVPFAVVDYHPAAIRKLQDRGLPAFFGDASDIEFLDELPLNKAKLVISTIPEVDDQLNLIKQVRSVNPKAIIICLLDYKYQMEDLYAAGANYVMLPHLLGGQWMIDVLQSQPWTKRTFNKLQSQQKDELQLRFTVGAE